MKIKPSNRVTGLALVAVSVWGCETSEEPNGDAAASTPSPVTPVFPPAVSTMPPPFSGAPPDAASPTSAVPAGNGPWCAVAAVLAKHCNACHDGQGTAGTPVGFLTHADVSRESAQFPGTKIYERIAARIEDTARPMPPQGGLSDEERSLLRHWVRDGGIGSSEVCPSNIPTVEEEWPEDCEESYQLLANDGGPGAFNVNVGEFYQDFQFTAPWKGDVQAVAFRPVVDNKKVLHHYILYQGTGAFLSGWSPGKAYTPLPRDVGVFLPASGSLRLTVHYYNSGPAAKTERDASGVEACVTRTKRPHTAAVMPFAANPVVPGGGARVEARSTCTVSASEPIHIITSSPHMHKLGVHAKFSVERVNGQTEQIHDKPFDFEEQTTWPVDFVVNNGDKITTTCVYQNTGNNLVAFGTSTDDEMCFNFALYYPMCAMRCVPDDPVASIWFASQGGGCPAR